MDQIAETLLDINAFLNTVVWGPYMLVLLLGVGIYVSVLSRFIQFSKFGFMMRETAAKIFRRAPKGEGDITPFQALNVAMGGTVGVGNIAGVGAAIAIGGPGAVFWMWVSGFLGMATKFAEVVLGQHFRAREEGGPMVGGPMTYIRRGLGPRWAFLAVLFSIFGAIAAFGIGNMVQANAVAGGFEHFGVPRWITGVILIVAVGLVTLGGIKRIAHVAMFCVPVMCSMYILGALVVVAANITRIPEALVLIVKYAFTPMAAAGGVVGRSIMLAMREGIAKGVFSNEAGLGSAPMAHATAQTDHPCRQGLWGIFEVFVDTIVMCTLTALVVILTGVWTSGLEGEALTMAGFAKVFGETIGFGLVAFSMILTAYDTNLAWCFYGETCASSLIGHHKRTRIVYRIIWIPFTLVGAIGGLRIIWDVSVTLNGLMAIPNLIAILGLGGTVAILTKQFFAGQKYVPPGA